MGNKLFSRMDDRRRQAGQRNFRPILILFSVLAPNTFIVIDQVQALDRELRPAATELSIPSHYLARLATTARQLAPKRTTSAGAPTSQSPLIQSFVPEFNNLSELRHWWVSSRFQTDSCKLSSLSFQPEVPVSTRNIARN